MQLTFCKEDINVIVSSEDRIVVLIHDEIKKRMLLKRILSPKYKDIYRKLLQEYNMLNTPIPTPTSQYSIEVIRCNLIKIYNKFINLTSIVLENE